ncbi:hypothetical protein LRP88_06601 [Fusarium phalaenopsidis]
MPSLSRSFDSPLTPADQALANLGYQNELKRTLSIWTVLGLQSVTMLWGWVFVTIVSICIAASLAEICAVYPTAGGPYFWAAMVSTKEYAPVASWITGWLNLVGNFLVTTSINFGGAQVVLSAATLWHGDFVPTAWQTILAFAGFTIFTASVNIFGSRFLNAINVAAMLWITASVIVLAAVLLGMAEERRPASFVFANYDASASGWPTGWSFFVGLLQGGAMVISVVVSGLIGLVYLIPVLFALPDIASLLAVTSNQPVGIMFKMITGSDAAALGLLLLLIVMYIFCSIGAFTASSRYTYAFARDGAIPYHQLWSRINKKLEMPLWAMLLNVIVNILLGLIYFGSSAAFNSFTGTATICLATSYAAPILISLLRRRKPVSGSCWSLRPFGFIINLVSVVWIFFSIILFCMPVALPVTASTMNYSSVVFTGFAVISLVWYIIYGRTHYKGPVASMEEVHVSGLEVYESQPDSLVEEGKKCSLMA